MAFDSNLGAVVGAEEGAMESIPGVSSQCTSGSLKDGRQGMKPC